MRDIEDELHIVFVISRYKNFRGPIHWTGQRWAADKGSCPSMLATAGLSSIGGASSVHDSTVGSGESQQLDQEECYLLD